MGYKEGVYLDFLLSLPISFSSLEQKTRFKDLHARGVYSLRLFRIKMTF
jgi:hypothetical protein